MDFNNDFKYDLQIGQIAEKKLADIFANKKIEVKYDKIAAKTGNIAIEYESRERASGISVTKADYYCYIIANTKCEDIFVLIDVVKLKALCRQYFAKNQIKNIGDNNTSKAVVIPLQAIFSLGA